MNEAPELRTFSTTLSAITYKHISDQKNNLCGQLHVSIVYVLAREAKPAWDTSCFIAKLPFEHFITTQHIRKILHIYIYTYIYIYIYNNIYNCNIMQQLPFYGDNEQELVQSILTSKVSIPNNTSMRIITFLGAVRTFFVIFFSREVNNMDVFIHAAFEQESQ